MLRAALLVASLLVAAPIGPLRAEAPAPGSAVTERSVKAAFLYKFLAFVEWPPSAFPETDTPVVFGVLGADDLAAELAEISAGRTFNNRAIVVRRLTEGDAVTGVQVLFVGRGEHARLRVIAQHLAGHPVLTVTDVPGGLDQGMMVNFVMVGGRVRFEISVEAAEKSGLRMSSRLLAVAQFVRTGS